MSLLDIPNRIQVIVLTLLQYCLVYPPFFFDRSLFLFSAWRSHSCSSLCTRSSSFNRFRFVFASAKRSSYSSFFSVVKPLVVPTPAPAPAVLEFLSPEVHVPLSSVGLVLHSPVPTRFAPPSWFFESGIAQNCRSSLTSEPSFNSFVDLFVVRTRIS